MRCMLLFNCLAFSGFLVILRSIWISEETDLFWLCIICWREELFFSVCQKWNTMCQTFYIPDFLCWKCLFGAALVSCKKLCNVHFDLFYLITVSATSWLLKLLQWIFRRQFFILKLFIPVRRQNAEMGNIIIQSPRVTITKAVKIASGCTGTHTVLSWEEVGQEQSFTPIFPLPKGRTYWGSSTQVSFILQITQLHPP